DAVPVVVDDPNTPNDGDIEVIGDVEEVESKFKRIGPILWNSIKGGTYKVRERSFQLRSMEESQRVKQSPKERREEEEADEEEEEEEEGGQSWKIDLSNQNMEMLIAAVMAHENIEGTSKTNKEEEDGKKAVRYEEIQDAVLSQISNPQEREAYLQFRTLQRAIRGNEFETSVGQWREDQSQQTIE
ncbi:hypothetical protein BGZ76_004841, partial [Entomortierella beljakovae]